LTATVVLAAVLPLGLAACGDPKVSEADVTAQLKKDPQTNTLPNAAQKCLAHLMVEKGNHGDLKAWINGKKKLDDVRGDSNGLNAAAAKCATAG
jgi:hypothetical protein